MATSPIPHRWKYDVFVSFRGEDIRKSFMDHLFNDFNQKGIYAFRDDTKLPTGEYISPHLYKAIEESKFLIVIFSKNYASSSWCMRELVKILECKHMGEPKHEFQIIFYDVKPGLVRKQTGSYAEAFAKHDVSNRTEVDKWKEALSMAANLSGWDLQDMTNGFESKFIDSISREILKKLCDEPLHVGENLVGIDFHFDKLDLSRFVGSDKVNLIGICGMSGIGKTTLAKAVYNLMCVHFEGSCFCEDVKKVTKRQGLIQVQLHMIGEIMKIEDLKIPSVGKGIMVVKKMMSSRPTLLVLDDVDDHEQLEALAGSPTWFCPGSLIIFTGKDKQLLRSHGVVEIHEMGNLDKCEALELFSLYAFGKRHPTEDFEEFASQIVKYLHGHPLALKVFGRLLYAKSVYVWKSELDRLQTYPNSEIVQKLRPSFDSLVSDQKIMFLDIACAFIGENKDFAASVLDGSHCSANAIIEVLADKFLITVSKDCLQMHELIQSMAREIVREEFIMTGKQRRLCISSASSGKKVAMTEATEVLVLLLRKSSLKVHIDANSFALMKNLRILKIYAEKEFDHKVELKGYNVKYSGSLDFLSNELSLFYWHGCPFEYLPSDFYPENIVSLDLSYSYLTQLWTTPKCLRRLKIMKLRYCCNLTTTPDFSEITNLEELDLEGCVNLVSVHPSIGMLKRLAVLNLRDCKRLQNFAGRVETDAITQLTSFVSSLINQSLSFGGQGRIQPRWWTSITAPFRLLSKQQHPQRSVSLAGLHMLKELNLSCCNLVQVPESIGGLSCLKELYLNGNNLLEVPESIGGLSCLEWLHLEGNNFTSLPGSLSQLSHLQYLRLDGCKKLEVLPELPRRLDYLYASDCTSLREVPESIGGLSCLKELYLNGNNLLEVRESIGGLSCLKWLHLEGNNFTSLPGSLSQLSHLQYLYLNGCKKLEVLPELPPSLSYINASDCTSLREVPGSSKDPFRNRDNVFSNCPNLFKNVTIDSEGSISKTHCLDSSITSQGSIHQLSAFLGYVGLETNSSITSQGFGNLDIVYHGNSIPEWFTNKSKGKHAKVELPSDWCYDKLRGYGACVVFKRKKPFKCRVEGYSVKNFDGASLNPFGYIPGSIENYFENEVIGIQDSYTIWLHSVWLHPLYTRNTRGWEEAKNFVTFSFFQENNEDVEVKECGVRLICDEDIQQEEDVTNLMFQDLPTLSQKRLWAISYHGPLGEIYWSC